jgi:hypothetical protein
MSAPDERHSAETAWAGLKSRESSAGHSNQAGQRNRASTRIGKMKKTASYKSFMNSPHVSFKHTTYFDSYDHFFGHLRGKEFTFVEIGVLDGGSLFMWRDYFGKDCRIIGVDLNPEARRWQREGFEIYVGNQSDSVFWHDFANSVGEIDIVLDDGGHTYSQQIITTESLLPHIRRWMSR